MHRQIVSFSKFINRTCKYKFSIVFLFAGRIQFAYVYLKGRKICANSSKHARFRVIVQNFSIRKIDRFSYIPFNIFCYNIFLQGLNRIDRNSQELSQRHFYFPRSSLRWRMRVAQFIALGNLCTSENSRLSRVLLRRDSFSSGSASTAFVPAFVFPPGPPARQKRLVCMFEATRESREKGGDDEETFPSVFRKKERRRFAILDDARELVSGSNDTYFSARIFRSIGRRHPIPGETILRTLIHDAFANQPTVLFIAVVYG